MGIISSFASLLKKQIKKAYYGKYYNAAYIAAEKNIYKKVHNIDQLYTRKQRKKLFFEGFNSDKFLWYDFDKFDKKDYISDFEHYTLTEL